MIHLDFFGQLTFWLLSLFAQYVVAPVYAYDPFYVWLALGGGVAIGVGMVSTRVLSVALLLVSPLLVQAYDDRDGYRMTNYRSENVYRRPDPPAMPVRPTFKNEMKAYTAAVVRGAVEGDFIKSPTVPNLVGQILANWTPAAPIADGRDVLANGYRSLKSGFKEHKKDTALAAVGFVPLVTEARKFKQAVDTQKALWHGIRLGKVVKELPPLTGSYARAFEGKIETVILRKGDIIYRAPHKADELAREPGRWFGLVEVGKRRMNETLFNIEQHGNPNKMIRRYEIKQDVSVYYGKVEGGTGYQVLFPPHLKMEETVQWRGSRKLK